MKKVLLLGFLCISSMSLWAMELDEYSVVPIDRNVSELQETTDQQNEPLGKQATIEQAGKGLQLAQLYSRKGSFENQDKARRLYLQNAAYRRELIRRRSL